MSNKEAQWNLCRIAMYMAMLMPEDWLKENEGWIQKTFEIAGEALDGTDSTDNN